jgi:hypothetical protein
MTFQAMTSRHLYWLAAGEFDSATARLREDGFKVEKTLLTPCQVMRSSGKKLIYAPPEIWSGMCKRQGSWYRQSDKLGKFMILSERRLPEHMDAFLDAEMTLSDFMPASLPNRSELAEIVNSKAYQTGKPSEWEQVRGREGLMFKMLFTFNRIWGWGDNLGRHWLGHRANHANFVSKKVTTRIDGEEVAYSVTENAGVCSSCAEFFNVVTPKSRKLVRACPGSVTFGGAERGTYYDVKPTT